jgi:hypothetical protein
MALPNLTVPKYKLTLPSTGKEITYRPFVMREEKILLMAQEGSEQDVLEAVDTVIKACTNGAVSTKTNPLFDIQYVFLQMRAKSVGEVAEFMLVCGTCSERIPATLNIAELEVERTEGHTDTIILESGTGVKMRYPRLDHLATLEQVGDVESIYNVIADCVESIFTEDEVFPCDGSNIEEVKEFLDNLTTEQFTKVRTFFDTMPKMTHTIAYTCGKCQAPNEIVLTGLAGFFD